MKKKVIITGATGMVGKGVLYECLDSEDIAQVLMINRSSLELDHPKLKEVIHDDFYDFSTILHELKGYDACFFCLGVSAVGLSEEKYHKITYDIAIGFAKCVLEANPNIIFNYVSGTGTDSSEKSSTMWARVKGKTENALLQMPFKKSYMFRPGLIIPEKGIKSRTAFYNIVYIILAPILPLWRFLAPKSITTTTKVGLAMINSVIISYEHTYLSNENINELAVVGK